MEIGLVLGGGGARGIAHIGALRALAERGLDPVAIAGCSIGAVVGSLVAAGHSAAHLEGMIRSLKRLDVVDVGKHGAILGNARFGEYLKPHLPNTFEELKIPFKATAVDCQTGSLVVLGSGPLIPAVLGSAATPGLLSPIFHEDWVLLDGGVLNNLPVDVIRAMTTRPVVAVDIAVPHNRKLNFSDKRSLRDRISSLFNRPHNWLTIELFLKSFDIPVRRVTQSLLAFHPPDVLVQPDLDPDFKREDFHRVDEALDAGYQATKTALDNASLER
jgi:NTE family protein